MDSATTTANGLASIATTDHRTENENHRRFIARPFSSPRTTTSLRTTAYSFPPQRSGTFLNGRFHEQQSHFLDSCFLCKKPLGHNRDIFMYRGDVPFCSVECRSEQIEIDEAGEKNRSLSASIKAMRKKEEREKSSNSSPNYPFHSDAVAAA